MAIETYNYDNLIAGSYPLVTEEVTVKSGENLTKGSIVEIASDKVNLIDATSGTPYAVMAEDVNASSADKKGLAYLSGEFNSDKLKVKSGVSGLTVASLKSKLRDINIYIKDTVS